MLSKVFFGAIIILSVIVSDALPAMAGWEIGAKAGFDTNIDRSVREAEEDASFSSYVSFLREPKGETRVDWSLAATVEGTAYKEFSDLNYAEITLAPAIEYVPNLSWRITVSPFLQAKAVRDSDQSAFALGSKINVREQLCGNFYLGQYYLYKNSSAGADIYSFYEHALGIYSGINFSKRVFGELGYEYSHGTSFLGVGQSGSISHGKARNRRYSSSYKEYVVKDTVNRNSFGANIGISVIKNLFTTLNYTFADITGEVGSATSHSGFVSIRLEL
jgi:hypothetical protein